MAAVNFSLTSLPEPPAFSPAQQGGAAGPQPNAAQAATPTQDTVTLAGRTAETQQSSSNNTGATFSEASAYFFAERQSFRASNGSTAGQTSSQPSVPTLPVKLSGPNSDATQQDAAGTAKAMQDAEAESTNTSPATGANAGSSAGSATTTSGAVGTTSQTPIAELAQLDSTLQEIGVNPQSISVFNRMAMLLYANDPAALRMFVQTLQTGAQVANAATNGADSSASQVQTSGANGEGQAATSAFAPGAAVSSASVQSATNSVQADASSEGGAPKVESADSSDSSAVGTFSLQLEVVQFAFASNGAIQSTSARTESQAGQLLDVTA